MSAWWCKLVKGDCVHIADVLGFSIRKQRLSCKSRKECLVMKCNIGSSDSRRSVVVSGSRRDPALLQYLHRGSIVVLYGRNVASTCCKSRWCSGSLMSHP